MSRVGLVQGQGLIIRVRVRFKGLCERLRSRLGSKIKGMVKVRVKVLGSGFGVRN